MADPSVHTTQLDRWLVRIRDGDRAAQDELLRAFADRLEKLARKMLRRFPRVRRWAETGDVLQNASLRLMRSLQEVRPGSVQAFLGLAAEQMRRELLDLTRQFFGPRGQGANHASHGNASPVANEPADNSEDPAELERWCSFHEGVERLPALEKEIVGLIFYHGWTQIQTAELLGISERTVRRHWEATLAELHQRFVDEKEQAV